MQKTLSPIVWHQTCQISREHAIPPHYAHQFAKNAPCIITHRLGIKACGHKSRATFFYKTATDQPHARNPLVRCPTWTRGGACGDGLACIHQEHPLAALRVSLA
jgi:hypothetical protein